MRAVLQPWSHVFTALAPAASMRYASLVVSWRPRPSRRRARRFMAFDRHMNLVLGDAEEYRTLPPKKGRSEEDVRRPPGPRLPEPALRPRKQRPGPAPQLALLPLFACADCAPAAGDAPAHSPAPARGAGILTRGAAAGMLLRGAAAGLLLRRAARRAARAAARAGAGAAARGRGHLHLHRRPAACGHHPPGQERCAGRPRRRPRRRPRPARRRARPGSCGARPPYARALMCPE